MARKFYLLLRGRVWYYRLRGELTFHTTHCTDRDQALEFVYTRVLAGRHGSGETLAEFVSRRRFFEWGRCEWIQRQHTAGHSFSRPVADQRKAHLEGHILPAFGATSLRDLGPVPIERWLLKLKLAPQTINHIRYTFRIVMSEAIRENLVAKNPLDQVVKHKVRAKSPLPFTLTELAKLFPHDEPELFRVWGDLKHAVCFLTLATTGLRSGEIRALNWGHILQQGIYIEFAVKPDNTIGAPKTGEKRFAAAPRRTLEALAAWRAETPFAGADYLVFFGIPIGRPIDGKTPLDRRSLSSALGYALKRAGVPREGHVPHSFRHTFNMLFRPVLSADALRAQLGHRTARMTDHYDNPPLEQQIARLEPFRQALESVWRRS